MKIVRSILIQISRNYLIETKYAFFHKTMIERHRRFISRIVTEQERLWQNESERGVIVKQSCQQIEI